MTQTDDGTCLVFFGGGLFVSLKFVMQMLYTVVTKSIFAFMFVYSIPQCTEQPYQECSRQSGESVCPDPGMLSQELC